MKKAHEGRPSIYPDSLKIMIAREYLTGALSLRELAVQHGLANPQVAQGFVRWYKKQEAQQQSSRENVAATPTHNAALEKELKEAQLKITALEMLIKNAGKELGIDIVKKLGTKQPPK